MTFDKNGYMPDSIVNQDAGSVQLTEIIDIPAIQALMDELSNLANLAFALIDLDGKVLVSAGWQDICTKYHRKHPDTLKHCIQSDTKLAAGAKLGEYIMYKCKNNLRDIAIPVVIEGRHLCNLFMGQFLFVDEPTDYDLFQAQARKFGFDEEAYISALDRVPRLTRKAVHSAINFYSMLANIISTLGLKNVELGRTIDNYKQTQVALQESEQRYRTLVGRLPIGIYRITPGAEGKILMANPAFLKIFGIDDAGLLKKIKITDLHAQPSDYKIFAELMSKGGCVSDLELRLKKIDGTIIWGSVSARDVRNSHGKIDYYDCVIKDITRRKQSEQELKARDELLQKLSDRVPGTIYQFQYFPDGRFCVPYASKSISFFFEVTPEEVRHDATPIFKRIHVDDLNDFTESILESYRTLQQWDYNFRVNLSRGHEKWVRGTATPEKMKDGSVLWHGSLIDITELKQVEEEIRARNEELGALNAFTNHMRVANNTTELLPIILDRAQSLLKAENGAITLLAKDQKKLVVACGQGIWKESAGLLVSTQEGLSGQVLQTQQTYISPLYEGDSKEALLKPASKIGPLAIVPLLSKNEPIGTLLIARSRGSNNNAFSSVEVQLLETIGDLSGNALGRERLHEEARRRLRQTQALRNIDMAITGSHDLRVTYSIILDEITRQLNVDAASVLRLEPYSMMLKYEASRGFNIVDLANIRLRMGEGYAGKVAINKQPCYIPNLKEITPDPHQGKYLAAEGFCTYYAIPLIAKGQLLGVLEVLNRDKFDSDEDWKDFFETLAGQTAIAIDNSELFHNLEMANLELVQSYDATIEGWAYALDLRDEATEGHSKRVTKLALDLAVQMGLKEENLSYLRRGALLHDIGKMGIPDSILLKPGKLSENEWQIMRKHPEYAYKMLSSVEHLRPAVSIPYCHHERFDGSGYPRGLKGEEIPLEARIFAVVDVFDALTSDRPYRKRWTKEEALDYIKKQSGRHFDPQVVEAFLEKMKNS